MEQKQQKKPNFGKWKVKAKDSEIIDCYIKNNLAHAPDVSMELTCQELQVPANKVQEVLRKGAIKHEVQAVKDKVVEEVIKDKIPILKEVVGLTLVKVRDWLENLDKDRLLAYSPMAMKQLSGIAKDMNELLRLDLGQTTANIGIGITHKTTQEDVRAIVNKFRELDPLLVEDATEVIE